MGLEEKGFLAHKTFGNTYQYYTIISKEEHRRGTLRSVIRKYFDNSYLHAVSSLVQSENISVEELKALIREVEKNSPPAGDKSYGIFGVPGKGLDV